jgi:glycosyltransferase involved in cell wall biosynthesis
VRHQLTELVEIRGIVHGEEKESLFSRARLFIHTSRWEGLPLVLLEALAHGVPCLLTPGTNVASEWASAGCGFETAGDPESIANSLISLSRQSLRKESELARNLAQKEYAWINITHRLIELYASGTEKFINNEKDHT